MDKIAQQPLTKSDPTLSKIVDTAFSIAPKALIV
jgi:hypothetical protein